MASGLLAVYIIIVGMKVLSIMWEGGRLGLPLGRGRHIISLGVIEEKSNASAMSYDDATCGSISLVSVLAVVLLLHRG